VRTPPRSEVVGGAVAGAVLTRALTHLLQAHPPGGQGRWRRTNFAGRDVSLLGGPAFAIGATGAALTCGGVPRLRWAVAGAALGAGAVGLYDDLAGSTHARGLLGHARALGRGEVTTGAMKVAGLGAVGLLVAGLAGHRGRDAVVTAATVAGAANLANLFDLRPGRALKLGLLAALPAVGGPAAGPAAAVLGAAAASLPSDLGEQTMLGDAGAGALGAAVGMALAQSTSARGRAGLLAGITALTLASERVSFTRVIDAVPALRAFDRLGRRLPGRP
jgi:UDP-GlcNAc:undecaprenyl-phosphate GlcNAc-1-phosphate transferase